MRRDEIRHYIALGAFLIVWLAFILYQNLG